MNEKIITVLIGLGLGIILAAVILFAPNILRSTPQPVPLKPQTPTPQTPPAPAGLAITIDTPQDNFWARESPLTLSGKTLPGVRVILVGPADEVTVLSDENGIYSGKLKLEDGENLIAAIASDSQGNYAAAQKSVTLEIKSE